MNDSEFLAVFLIIYLLILFVALAVSIASYVIQSLSLYSIAKRRAIQNPFLAWIPVGNTWIMGSISDQFQFVRKGKVTKRKMITTALHIASILLMALYFVVYFAAFFLPLIFEEDVSEEGVLFAALIALAMFAVSIAASVFQYIVLYDLYCSCQPANAVLYLILSILVPISLPILLFLCRNKDEGMIPQEVPAAPNPPQHDPNAF